MKVDLKYATKKEIKVLSIKTNDLQIKKAQSTIKACINQRQKDTKTLSETAFDDYDKTRNQLIRLIKRMSRTLAETILLEYSKPKK